MSVQVVLPGWETGCCQPVPAVGDRVAWRLRFVPSDAPEAGAYEWDRAVPQRGGWVLEQDGATAWAGGDGAAPQRGRLVYDGHGQVPDDLPLTRGVVRRVTPLPGRGPGGVDDALLVDLTVDP